MFFLDIGKLVDHLNNLRVSNLQIRIFNVNLNYEQLDDMLGFFKNSLMRGIEIFLPYTETISVQELHQLITDNKRIFKIVIFRSPFNKIVFCNKPELDKKVVFINKDIEIDTNDVIALETFEIRRNIFLEAKNFNVGLNRKLWIKQDGSISNGSQTRLAKYINEDFNLTVFVYDNKDLFVNSICNDKIEVCKDCQYRYMCISTSKLEYNDNKIYKKEMCSFNPYTNSWNTNTRLQGNTK